MLWRGRTSAGALGSAKAVWAVNRARPSSRESKVLEDQRLARVHVGEVEPAVARIVGELHHLADSIGVDQIGQHEVPIIDALGIADGEWAVLHRARDRPPDLHHGKAVLQ